MLAELQQLVDRGQTKLVSLSVEVKSKGDLTELIDFFSKNKFTISEVELRFTNEFSQEEEPLIQRSRLTIQFIEILNQIEGLESFKLNSSVENYALVLLLQNEAINKLEKLTLSHKREAGKPINSNSFYEEDLVNYLKSNLNLQSLTIEDIHADIQAKEYPRLKAALSNHPKLSRFSQGLGSILSKTTLDKDSELLAALERKIPIDLSEMKRVWEQHFDKNMSQAAWRMQDLDGYRKFQSTLSPSSNSWFTTTSYLQSGLAVLQELKTQFANPAIELDNLDRKNALIAVYIQYLTLVKRAAYLQGHSDTTTAMHAHQNQLNLFWQITRPDLLQKIQAVKDHDFSKILQEIDKESKQLTAIQNKALIANYPDSYSRITGDISGELLKARTLLVDYTKNNSAVSRFFHGHWNRHHTSEVNAIVLRINSPAKNAINSVEDLVAALNAIPLVNQDGSLARRIRFITDNFTQEPIPELSASSLAV